MNPNEESIAPADPPEQPTDPPATDSAAAPREPHAAPSPPRFVRPHWAIVALVALAGVLIALVIADRRAPVRPDVEVIDQSGAGVIPAGEIDRVRNRAAGLPYPVTVVIAARPANRGDWERSLTRLAQPDRLVIGLATDEGWAMVARGAELPLPAGHERAIQMAIQPPLRAGDPARGLNLGIAQAQSFGDPRPPRAAHQQIDPALLRLVVSFAAPALLIAGGLIAIARRARTIKGGAAHLPGR